MVVIMYGRISSKGRCSPTLGLRDMTKDQLLGIFRTAHNNCKLVYVSVVLFGDEDMATHYEKWSASLNIPEPYDQEEILALLKDRDVLKRAFSELDKSVHRAALRELFEMTTAYCRDTNQLDHLKAQSWYQFWRILRNCFSHDFKCRFNRYDKSKLPVTWDGVTIDTSHEGQSLLQGHLSRRNLLDFIDDVKKFVERELA